MTEFLDGIRSQVKGRLDEIEPEYTTLRRTLGALYGDEPTEVDAAEVRESERLRHELEAVSRNYEAAHEEAAAYNKEAAAYRERADDLSEKLLRADKRVEEKVSELGRAQARITELQSRPTGNGKVDPWELPSIPDDAPVTRMRANKAIGSDDPFVTLPLDLIGDFDTGAQFHVVRQGDNLVLVPNGESVVKKAPIRLTTESVRDAACGFERPFTRLELADKLGCTPSAVGAHMTPMVESGKFTQVEEQRGKARVIVYTYVDPRSERGPTQRPRHDTPTTRSAGRTVPGTGKPAGPASKPGKLKAQQQRAANGGRAVRKKRVGGVRK